MPFPTPTPRRPPTETVFGSGNVAGETAKTSEDRQVDPNLFLTVLYVSVVPFPCGRKMQPSVARPFPTLANSIEILLVDPLNRHFIGLFVLSLYLYCEFP